MAIKLSGRSIQTHALLPKGHKKECFITMDHGNCGISICRVEHSFVYETVIPQCYGFYEELY
jgi:hypothetical protein